jgi:hypothetical protein
MDCSKPTNRRIMKTRSIVIVYAKARAKPAIDALMDGDKRATSAVAPATPLERRLKRVESHLLTV